MHLALTKTQRHLTQKHFWCEKMSGNPRNHWLPQTATVIGQNSLKLILRLKFEQSLWVLTSGQPVAGETSCLVTPAPCERDTVAHLEISQSRTISAYYACFVISRTRSYALLCSTDLSPKDVNIAVMKKKKKLCKCKYSYLSDTNEFVSVWKRSWTQL